MKSTVETLSPLERRLNIEIPAQTVAQHFDQVFKGIQKQATIKGFRQGKAPMATIKSMYADRVKQDVADELMQKHYFEAVREHSLEPITYPEFEFGPANENSPFTFTAQFEVRPEIKLSQYTDLEVETEKFEFDETQIEQVLKNIQASRAQLVDLLEDRPAQTGDVAVIDFVGTVDGQALEGGTGNDHNLELGSKQFIDGFEEGIVGMKLGETRTLNLKFPEQYHAGLQGKPVEFTVTLKKIKKKDLPALTDEFAQSLGGIESLDALKKTIREDLERSEKERIESALKNRVLRVLVQKNPVQVPPSLLKSQKESLIEDTQKRMAQQGMSEAEFEDYRSKWDKDFEKTASEMIQSGFLIDAIAKKENLNWTKEDVDAKLQEQAKQIGMDVERIREFYNRPEQMQRMTSIITEEKVLGLLLKTAKLKEVPKNQIKD